MTNIFHFPRATLFDAVGDIDPGGKIQFYQQGTTTPLAIYSNPGLSVALTNPVEADAAGRLPTIYMAAGLYKIVVYDSDDNVVFTQDNLDTGFPASSGALLAALPAFFAADSATEAREALLAASQSELDDVAAIVSDIEAQITGVGGSLGDLAGLDTITRSQLGSGFGVVMGKRSLVASTATNSSPTDTIPYDNTIPQNSEGAEILTGSFTPVSASSVLQIEAIVPASMSAAQNACIALFRDTTADAIAASWHRFDSANMQTLRLVHRMASWGTSASTLALRAGGAGNTFHLLANGTGTRVGGGVLLASLFVTEFITF